MKKKNNVFVEKPQHLKNVKRESEYKEEKQSYESIWGKVLDLLSWAGFGIFVLWALSLLAAGNPVSAIITAVFAFFISPLRKKVFERLNIRLAAKKTAFIGCFLFLSSCGTFMGLTEVEETVDDSQQMVVVETIDDESSPEKVLFTESET